MSSRSGQIFAAVTNTAAKRLGISCAAVAFAVTLVWGAIEVNQESLWRQAEDRVDRARANEMGLGIEPMKAQIRAGCEKKFGLDCVSAELYGGFGEIVDAAHSRIQVEYYLEVIATAFLAASSAGVFAWVAIALFIPICLNYWAWLRRG